MKIISRKQARAEGLTFFFTGNPCRRGHMSTRYVSSYECLECCLLPQHKDRRRQVHIDNKEHRASYLKEWKEKNRDRVNYYGRQWAKNNPEKHALRARLRKARIRKSEGSHTIEEVLCLLQRQKCKCASCGKSLKERYEVDHIVPISKGGANYIRNIQLLCVSCNRRKNAKDPLLWARENGRLL